MLHLTISSIHPPSIRLPIPPTIQKPLLPIQLEEAPRTPLLPPLQSPPSPYQSANDDTDQHAQRHPRMTRRGATEAEEDALDETRGGFGGDFGRAGDDLGQGFEDGGAGGHDGGAGYGCIPIPSVLRRDFN